MSRTRIPPILEPFLKLPPELSLILLTSTLGCSTTWLASRFVSAVLQPPKNETKDDSGTETSTVILVSWLRDKSFWSGEIRRTTGLDTSKVSSSDTFVFIDGSVLPYSPKAETALDNVLDPIREQIQRFEGRKIFLVLDAPDVLLGTGVLKANRLSKLLLMFRETVHSTLLTLSSDLPLVSAATSSASRRGGGAIDTPLEVDTAAFLTQQAHLSRFIMAVRELDTGAANDVSGVLRVTRGGSSISNEEVGEEVEVAKEMEALFLVQRDGGVKVFERGGGG